MKTQIPIYRAKKIDSDEYVEGDLRNIVKKIFIQKGMDNINEVDPSTLAIHFPNMIDSEGTKIFASLNKIGGDIIHSVENPENFEDMRIIIGNRYVAVVADELGEPAYLQKSEWKHYKVTGIQK